MWYKTALTTIDPTGQINFPDMGGHKFNLNDLRFNVVSRNYSSTRSVSIFAYIPAVRKPIGELTFTFDRQKNTIDIEGVLVKKVGNISIDDLKEKHNDEVQLKTTGIGIGKKLYQKFLEVVQNDEELSKADYVRGSVHSQQAYKAKNNAFGKPFSATSKFHYPEERQVIQDKIFELEKELEDPNITFIRKSQILQLLNALEYELGKSAPVSHDESLNILTPASWSNDGSYTDHLFDLPSVETKHKIPVKSEDGPKKKLQNPSQLSLDVAASKKKYRIAQTTYEIHPKEQEAKKYYGITKDPYKAGYILRDGSFLDFSEGQPERTLDHRDVSNILDTPEESKGDRYSDYVVPFLNLTGAIRCSYQNGEWSVDISAKPTDAQIRKIEYWHTPGKYFNYDVDPLGINSYIENASKRKVMLKLEEIQGLL